MKHYICIGKIITSHGVVGQVKLASYTEYPEDILAYGPLYDKKGEKEFIITDLKPHKEIFIAKIEGVKDRNAADRLRQQELYIDRDLLPEVEEEDSFYCEDLVGLKVLSKQKKPLGVIKAVHDFGAGDILEIQFNNQKDTDFVPFKKDIITEVDLTEGFVIYQAPEVEYIQHEE